MLELPRRIVLFDLECTAQEGTAARNWSGPGEHRELVQLGAIMVDTRKFTKKSVFKALVKPAINPILSRYFIDLTHITQEEVDERGVDFATAFVDFFTWCEECELYCFDSRLDGSRLFDRDVLIENCDLYGLEFLFDPEKFHNINEIFFQHGYKVKQSGAAPEAFGLKIPARPHDALNDANGLLIALKALSKRI